MEVRDHWEQRMKRGNSIELSPLVGPAFTMEYSFETARREQVEIDFAMRLTRAFTGIANDNRTRDWFKAYLPVFAARDLLACDESALQRFSQEYVRAVCQRSARLAEYYEALPQKEALEARIQEIFARYLDQYLQQIDNREPEVDSLSTAAFTLL